MSDIGVMREQGWYRPESDSFLFDREKLASEFDQFYQQNLLQPKYRNVAELQLSDIHQSEEIKKIFSLVSSEFSKLDDSLAFSKLWLVKSGNKDVNPDGLPYVPHIDKLRFAKAMFYLDDVNIQDGPLTIARQSPEKYEQIRQKMGDNHKETRQNWITDLPKDSLVPCTGSAGTLIYFDTNCPHAAGIVEEGHHRRVLRFDFEKPEWNSDRSLLSIINSCFLRLFRTG